jgi:hypothetical protein
MTAAAAGTFGGVRTHIYIWSVGLLSTFILCFHGCCVAQPDQTDLLETCVEIGRFHVRVNLDLLDEIKAAR